MARYILLALLLLGLTGCEPQSVDFQPARAEDSLQVLAFHYDPCAACDADEVGITDLVNRGVQVDVVQYDDRPHLFTRYGVEATPTYVLLRDGVEINRFPSLRPMRLVLRILLPLLF